MRTVEAKEEGDWWKRSIKWRGKIGCRPERFHEGDAGFDLICSEKVEVPAGEFRDLDCGLSIELPSDVWAMITGRSSTLRRRGLLVAQGIIDSGYRGPLFAGVWNMNGETVTIERGERLAQLIPMPLLAAELRFERVGGLAESSRGSAGFGSTGK